MWSVLEFFCLLVPLLVVAFFTLFQRKVLGLTAVRLGVNKVSVLGVLQPILDALKLLTKSVTVPNKASSFFFLVSPGLLFLFSLGFWGSFSLYGTSSTLLGVFLVLLLLGVSSFSMFGVSWFSGAKYPSLSVLRSCSLSISLEACLGILFFGVVLWSQTLSFPSSPISFSFIFFGFWMFLILVDTMTSPFDLVEAESELVSGFNTEYGSTLFIFIFLSEYMIKIFFSVLTSYMFFNSSISVMFLVLSFFLTSQTTFLRLKSEWVMGFLWLKVLPPLICLLGVGYFLT